MFATAIPLSPSATSVVGISSSVCAASNSSKRSNVEERGVKLRSSFVATAPRPRFAPASAFGCGPAPASFFVANAAPKDDGELTDEVIDLLIPDSALPTTFSPSQARIYKRNMAEKMRRETAPKSNFRVFVKGASIQLSWATAGEKDNAGFLVERKAEGSDDFELIGSYETSPELKGQGTTEQRTVYRFTDTTAVPGKTYLYRLSDCDGNGKSTPMATEGIEFDLDAEELDETDLKAVLPAIAGVVGAFLVVGLLLFGNDFFFDLTRP